MSMADKDQELHQNNVLAVSENAQSTITSPIIELPSDVFWGLLKSSFSVNMNLADTDHTMDNKRLFKLKEQAVIKLHDGKPFVMRSRIKDGKEVFFYRAKCGNRQVESNDYHTFINKLAAAHGIDEATLGDGHTIDRTFKLAISEKAKVDNSNENTLKKIRYDYERYIDRDFAKKTIEKITDYDLKAYTKKLITGRHMTKKSYLSYKGVLNLIFKYAINHDIISSNPVQKIDNGTYLKGCDTSKATSEDKILSAEEIEAVKAEANRRKSMKMYHGYCVYAFVCELAIETGMRAAELCSLKESDIKENYIHIHSQQLNYRRAGGKDYYYADWTKDEKGVSRGGRKFPLTPAIIRILSENQAAKSELKLNSEYVFCNRDNEWIKTDAYETFLRRMMTSLKMPVTNNHAFRMSLNSNVFIPLGIPETERAALLGHSVETNLKYYSFGRKNNLDYLVDVLSNATGNTAIGRTPPGHPLSALYGQ